MIAGRAGRAAAWLLTAAAGLGLPALAETTRPAGEPGGAGPPAARDDVLLRGRLEAPFAVRGQFPLALPFLDIAPRSAFLKPGGTLRFALGLAYETTHAVSDDLLALYAADDGAAHDGMVTRAVLEQVAAASPSGHAYFVDGETARLTAGLAWSVTDRIELGATVPLVAHAGGFLDGPIEAYHDALGFPDGGRPPFARDQYVAGLSDSGRTVFLGGAPGGLRPGDLLLEARVAIASAGSGNFALAGTASFELPTGGTDRLDGNGALDTGAGLGASWRMRRWSLHAGAQYAWLGDWSLEPALAPRNRRAGFCSAALLVGSRTSIVAGFVGGSGPFARRRGGGLGDTGVEVAIGLRHATSRSGDLEVGLLENILADHNVPDVGLFLGWSWRRD